MVSVICQALLDAHPNITLGVSLDGSCLYSNSRGIEILGGGEDKAGKIDFCHIWNRDPDQVTELLRRCGASSSWHPVTLVLKHGPHSGMRIPLRGRGLMTDGDQEIFVMLVQDEGTHVAFEEHRRFVKALNAELAELRRIESQLEKALKNESRLRRELVHRVKNNLSQLSSMINLRARNTDKVDVQTALGEVSQRLRTIALVHEVLDSKNEIDVVNADELIEKLCHLLENSICPPSISIQRVLTPVKLYVEDATPLCLLLNELITNSIKHGFPGMKEGKINVTLRYNGVNKLEVNVADDGVGFDAAAVKGATGNAIIKALVEQLHGDLSVTSDDGVDWRMIFSPSQFPEDNPERS